MPEETTIAVTTAASELPNMIDREDSDAFLLICIGVLILALLLIRLINKLREKRRKPCAYCDCGQKILCRRLDTQEQFQRFDPEEFYAVYCPICGQLIPKHEE